MRKYFPISDSIIFLSKFLHTTRDMLIGIVLGTSPFADAFFGISRVLNLITSLFANGIFSRVFSLIFSRLFEKNRSSALQFSHEIQFTLALMGTIAFIAAEAFTEKILFFLMPGILSSPARDSLITTAKIAFPSILFIPLTSLYYSMLYSGRNFSLIIPYTIMTDTALIAVILCTENCSILLLHNMGYAIALSGMTQMLFLLYRLEKSDLVPALAQSSLNKNIKHFFKCFLPLAVASEAYQINALVGIFFASQIPQAISSLCYAEGIILLFFLLIDTSLPKIAGCSLTTLTRNTDELMEVQDKAIKKVITACIPVTIMLVFMTEHITTSLFLLGGKFDIESVRYTTHMLEVLAFALPAHVLNKNLLEPYLALDNLKTRTSFIITSAVLNAAMNIILVPYYSYIGIAIALCATTWLNTLLTFIYLRRQILSLNERILHPLTTILFPASTVVFFIQICEAFIESHPGISTIYPLRLVSLAIVCVSAMFIYYFLLSQLKKIVWKGK